MQSRPHGLTLMWPHRGGCSWTQVQVRAGTCCSGDAHRNTPSPGNTYPSASRHVTRPGTVEPSWPGASSHKVHCTRPSAGWSPVRWSPSPVLAQLTSGSTATFKGQSCPVSSTTSPRPRRSSSNSQPYSSFRRPCSPLLPVIVCSFLLLAAMTQLSSPLGA